MPPTSTRTKFRRWATVDEIAWLTDTTRALILRQLAAGSFPGQYRKVNGRWRINPSSIPTN